MKIGHMPVTLIGDDARAIAKLEKRRMECEDFLEPLQDQEYDDDL